MVEIFRPGNKAPHSGVYKAFSPYLFPAGSERGT